MLQSAPADATEAVVEQDGTFRFPGASNAVTRQLNPLPLSKDGPRATTPSAPLVVLNPTKSEPPTMTAGSNASTTAGQALLRRFSASFDAAPEVSSQTPSGHTPLATVQCPLPVLDPYQVSGDLTDFGQGSGRSNRLCAPAKRRYGPTMAREAAGIRPLTHTTSRLFTRPRLAPF